MRAKIKGKKQQIWYNFCTMNTQTIYIGADHAGCENPHRSDAGGFRQIREGNMEYHGKEQVWQTIDIGYEPAFKTITGNIFEFGMGYGARAGVFNDNLSWVILQ